MVPEVADCQIGDYLTVLIWDGQLLEMFVHKGHSWRVSLASADLNEMAQAVRMTTDAYIRALFDAVSGQMGIKNCPFSVSEREGRVEIVWSKKLNEKGIKLTLGSFSLLSTDEGDSTRSCLIQRLLSVISRLSTGYSALEKDNEVLRQIGDAAVTKYDVLVEEIEDKEIQWFSKFSAILNEKKIKIKQLEEASSGLSMSHTNPEECPRPTAKRRSTEVSSHNSSKSDEDDLLIPKLPKTSRNLLSRPPKISPAKSTVAKEADEDRKDPSLDDLIDAM